MVGAQAVSVWANLSPRVKECATIGHESDRMDLVLVPRIDSGKLPVVHDDASLNHLIAKAPAQLVDGLLKLFSFFPLEIDFPKSV